MQAALFVRFLKFQNLGILVRKFVIGIVSIVILIAFIWLFMNSSFLFGYRTNSAISKSENFLLSQIEENGALKTSGIVADVWELEVLLLSFYGNNGQSQSLGNSVQFLKNSQLEEGGWFAISNRSLVGDYNGPLETGLAIYLLKNGLDRNSFEKACNFLLDSQNSDGGWDWPIPVTGYSIRFFGDKSVSSFALLGLATCIGNNIITDNAPMEKAIAFLNSNKTAHSFSNAFGTPLIETFAYNLALSAIGEGGYSELTVVPNSDGGFGYSIAYTNKSSPTPTCLAALSMLYNKNFQDKPMLKNAINWILKNQDKRGAWIQSGNPNLNSNITATPLCYLALKEYKESKLF